MKLFNVLAVSMLLLGTCTNVEAEIVKIEATLKSVDASSKSITVERNGKEIKLDVSSKASISSNGSAATLEQLGTGQSVTIEYEPQFEIVTKIMATGDAQDSPACELLVLSEINGEGSALDPWVSPDGLTIYWTSEGSIWTAKRKDSQSFFENKKRLMAGRHATVSGDGLQMFLLSKRTDGQKGETLWVSTRRSEEEAFRRPSEIRELKSQSNVKNPALSKDGLTLIFNQNVGDQVQIAYSTRRSITSAWSTPKPMPVSWRGPARLTWGSVSQDGKSLFCVVEGDPATSEEGMLRRFKRPAPNTQFSNPEKIQFEGITRLICRSPRYVQATNELFFARRFDDRWQLCVLKGFEKGATVSDLSKLDGEWSCIASEENGKVHDDEKVREQRRRLIIEDNSLKMQRTGANWTGEFTIDPSNGNFDWKGTGPQGQQVEWIGIGELQGDTLKLCFIFQRNNLAVRPTEFKSKPPTQPGLAHACYTFRRSGENR